LIKETRGVTQQGKKNCFTSAEGCSHRPEPDRQNTLSGDSGQFLSLSALSLMDGFGFTIFAIGYLEKGAHEVRVSLKQGEQENSFEQYSSLSKQFEIRTSSDKQLCLQELCKVKQCFTKHVDSNLGRLAGIYTVILIHELL
jgi:hypothetical protein